MDRIDGDLAQLRTQCVNRLNDIDAEPRGPYGRPSPHAQLARVLHERLLRVEDAMPLKRSLVPNQSPATASEIDLWEAQPDAPPNYPIAIRALIARIRQYEVDLLEARDWAILNRKRADAAEAGQKVEPLT